MVKNLPNRICHFFEFIVFFLQVTAWFLAYFWMLFFEIPHISPNYPINILLSLITISLMICLYRALFMAFIESKTNFIPPPEIYDSDLKPIKENSENKQIEAKICKKCGVVRKIKGIHHCTTCEKCVYKMDHHCICLATCVNAYNYVYFISYIFVGIFTAIYFTIINSIFMYSYCYLQVFLLFDIKK